MTTEAELQAIADSIAASVGNAVAELASLETQVAGLTAGQPVSQEQLDALNASLSGSKTALDSAVATAQTPPAPVGPPAPPAPTPTPGQPVYLHLTADAVDAAQWVASGFETVPAEGAAAQPLFFFSGDTSGGSPTGAADGVWEVYTGASQVVPPPVS